MLAPGEMQSNPDLCFLKSTQRRQCGTQPPGTTLAQGQAHYVSNARTNQI